MGETNDLGLNLLLRFLEMAWESGLSLGPSDLEPLLDKCGIDRGSQDHFALVWADYQRQRASGQSPGLEDLKKLYPGWAPKFDSMAVLEDYLGGFGRSARRVVEEKLRAKGYRILRELKGGQRTLTCLAMESSFRADGPGGDGLPAAAPIVLKAGFGAYQFRLLKREYLLCRTLSPDHFLRPAAMEASGDVAWLSMEYCPMGSLDQAGPLSQAEVWDLWTQSAKALALLHQRMVCHNDIKASNLLLDRHRDRLRLRLADLEHGTREGKPVNRQRSIWDHPDWEPGQMARRRDDVYRLGMTIAWLLAPAIASPDRLANRSRLETVAELPDPFREPLSLCLRDNSLERIDNGAELHRVLNGSKDQFRLPEVPSPNGTNQARVFPA